MAEKDTIERVITADPEIVAEIINLVFFGGKTVATASQLRYVKSGLSYLDSNGRVRALWRDCPVMWTEGEVVISFLGIESQTAIDRDMPLRVIGYDGANYREQLDNPNAKRYPVITLVLYYGKEPWKKYLTLKERFDIPKKYEKALSPYVNDYKVHVIDVRRLTLADIKKLRTDFAFIASMFYKIDHPEEEVVFPAVKNDTLIMQFLQVFFGESIAKYIPQEKLREGGYTMDEVVAEIKKDWFEQGRQEERQATEQRLRIIEQERDVAEQERDAAEQKWEVAERRLKGAAQNLYQKNFTSIQIAETLGVDQAMVELWLDEI